MPVFDPLNPPSKVIGANNTMLQQMNGNKPDGFALRYIRHCIESYVDEHESEFQNIDLDKLSISCGFSVSAQTTRFVLSYRDDEIYEELRRQGTSVAGVSGPVINSAEFTINQINVDENGWKVSLDSYAAVLVHTLRVAALRVSDAKAILRDLGELTPDIKASRALRTLRGMELPELDAPVGFVGTE